MAAFTPSTTNFGLGCGRAAATLPTIGATTLPKLGATYTLRVRGFQPNTFGGLIVSTNRDQWGLIRLPMSLAAMAMPNCKLWVRPDIVALILTDSSGNVSITSQIPITTPIGFEVFCQAYASDAKANPAGVATTNACAIVFSK